MVEEKRGRQEKGIMKMKKKRGRRSNKKKERTIAKRWRCVEIEAIRRTDTEGIK